MHSQLLHFLDELFSQGETTSYKRRNLQNVLTCIRPTLLVTMIDGMLVLSAVVAR